MKFVTASALLLTLVLCVGCNSSSTASGTVTFNGQPLETGEVLFHPTTEGAIATGTILKGNFEMSTGQDATLAAGSYKVTVTANEKPDFAKIGAEGAEFVPKRLTPEIYANPTTTPLKAEVKPGANKFTFDLSSQ